MKIQSKSIIRNPKVSIVVPNYNHALFLEKRLHSIFNQTFQDFEVILLDDGSTDNSQDILKSYKDHPKVSHCILKEQNSGFPFNQWRNGIQLSIGEYVWIAESDDWAELTFLEKLLPRLDKSTGIAFCKSHTYFNARNELSSYYFPEDLFPKRWNENTHFNGRVLLENFHSCINTIPNASASLFRKDLAVFDDDLHTMNFCGDWLFWARLMTKTDLFFLAEKLNYWRLSEQTTRARKTDQTEVKRFKEGLICIKKICALCGKKKVNMKNYDWLFLNYFSTQPVWELLFQPKPDIPVNNLNFRSYLIRSAINLSVKKSGRELLGFWRGNF